MSLSTKIAPVFIKTMDSGPNFNQKRDHELKSISAKLNDLLGSPTSSEIMRMGDLLVHPLSVSDQKKLLSMQLIGDRHVACKIPSSFAVSKEVITGVPSDISDEGILREFKASKFMPVRGVFEAGGA